MAPFRPPAAVSSLRLFAHASAYETLMVSCPVVSTCASACKPSNTMCMRPPAEPSASCDVSSTARCLPMRFSDTKLFPKVISGSGKPSLAVALRSLSGQSSHPAGRVIDEHPSPVNLACVQYGLLARFYLPWTNLDAARRSFFPYFMRYATSRLHYVWRPSSPWPKRGSCTSG